MVNDIGYFGWHLDDNDLEDIENSRATDALERLLDKIALEEREDVTEEISTISEYFRYDIPSNLRVFIETKEENHE